jgi:TP901 family phage tail tape measure protein
MAKTSKLELIMELSDKLFNNKLQQVQAKLGAGVDKMDAKLTKLSGGHIKLAAAVGAGFAAIGGIALVSDTIGKSIDATEKFNTAFLPIRNLNLDKSKAEMDSYRNKIRDGAYEVGAALDVSSTALYDLQSLTGLYGDKAIDVFKKVGNYSVATGANLGDAMNSTAKSMKAFELGVGDIDAMLVSNAKTVQVGKTTYDELARVQTEYAGSASAAGQSFDVGNKVFAMFTSISKNADIAANSTKTFFDGLGQQADEIKKYLHIDVFDTKGNMKDADKILMEISDKFKGLSEKQITGIINKIGGPEGLRMALAKVKTGAEDMIMTFDTFDSSKFSIADALENAKGDYATMKKIFSNQIDAVYSKFGDQIIPKISAALESLQPVLDWMYKNIDWLIPAIGSFTGALALLTAGVWLFNIATAANPIVFIILQLSLWVALIGVAIAKFDDWGAAFLWFLGPIGRVIEAFKLIYDHWDSIVQAFKTDGIIGGLKRIGMVLLDVLLKPLQQILEMIANIDPTGIAQKGVDAIKAFRESQDLRTAGEKAKDATGANAMEALGFAPKQLTPFQLALMTAPKGDGKKPPKDKTLGNDINKVAGQANQVRNISIVIDAFNKGGINVAQSAYAGMTKDDVEAWFKEMMRRVVINAENA